MMSIIAASRLRGLSTNIIIGGVSSFITTKEILADYLTISSTQISTFNIIGDTVFARVDDEYQIGSSALTFVNNNDIRFFDQGQGGISGGFTRYFANSSVFYVTSKTAGRCSSDEMYEGSNLKYAFFENAQILRGYKSFANLNDCRIYLGSFNQTERLTGGSNSIFLSSTDIDVYLPVGAPEIPANYNRIEILDTTTPASVNDLSVSEIGATYIKLSFTEITNADFYEVWILKNGVYELFSEISGSDQYIPGLDEQTNYNFKITTCDQYWNGSGFFEDTAKQAFSNTINVTTTTLPSLFQNAVAYYRLDETSGDAIDVVNGYNGTLFGGVTQGVAGKIGLAIESDAVGDKYFEIPTQAFDENNFHTSGWFYFDSSNNKEITMWCRGSNGKGLAVKINSDISCVYLGNVALPTVSSGAVDNDWNNYVISKTNGNIKIYINNVLKYDETETYLISGTALRYGIVVNADGTVRTGTASPFKLDEIYHRETPYTAAERSDLYNNGNGTTI